MKNDFYTLCHGTEEISFLPLFNLPRICNQYNSELTDAFVKHIFSKAVLPAFPTTLSHLINLFLPPFPSYYIFPFPASLSFSFSFFPSFFSYSILFLIPFSFHLSPPLSWLFPPLRFIPARSSSSLYHYCCTFWCGCRCCCCCLCCCPFSAQVCRGCWPTLPLEDARPHRPTQADESHWVTEARHWLNQWRPI